MWNLDIQWIYLFQPCNTSTSRHAKPQLYGLSISSPAAVSKRGSGSINHVLGDKSAPVLIFRKCADQATLFWVSLPFPAFPIPSMPGAAHARTAVLCVGAVPQQSSCQSTGGQHWAGWAMPSLTNLSHPGVPESFASCSTLSTLYVTSGWTVTALLQKPAPEKFCPSSRLRLWGKGCLRLWWLFSSIPGYLLTEHRPSLTPFSYLTLLRRPNNSIDCCVARQTSCVSGWWTSLLHWLLPSATGSVYIRT